MREIVALESPSLDISVGSCMVDPVSQVFSASSLSVGVDVASSDMSRGYSVILACSEVFL